VFKGQKVKTGCLVNDACIEKMRVTRTVTGRTDVCRVVRTVTGKKWYVACELRKRELRKRFVL
jgi:hypothetical protein